MVKENKTRLLVWDIVHRE